MELVIAEKKEVAEAICKSLSSSFQQKKNHFYCQDLNLAVGWASGHLMKSADPEYFDPSLSKWDLNSLPIEWPVKFIPDPKKIHLLKTLGELLKKATCVYNACDIDSAGAYIFNAIIEYHRYRGKIKRVFITDNNLIKKAWSQAQDGNVDYLSAMSEKARSIADQRFGYNMTRALTLQSQKQGYDGSLNCGRVQVFFIGTVVARALEISNFKKHKYYDAFVGLISNDGDTIPNAKLIPSAETYKLDDKNRIIDKAELEPLKSLDSLTVKKVEITEKEVPRPFPYDLSSLQGECDRIFGITLDDVLNITQSLREKGLCTYNRTDSRALHDEAFDDAPQLLEELSQVDFLSPIISLATVDPNQKSKCFDSSLVTAHHGIIPCMNTNGISELSDIELKVYYLIARNYIVQFLPPQIKQYSACTLQDEFGNTFKASYTRTRKKGWKILFEKEPQEDKEEDESEEICDFDFSMLSEGDELRIDQLNVRELESKPRQYFTITSLLNAAKRPEMSNESEDEQSIKDMLKFGNGGVGTSATRTPILTQLFERGVLKKVGNKVRETEKATLLYRCLPSDITSPKMSAHWALQQHSIAHGKLSVEDFTNDVIQLTNQMVSKIKEGIDLPESMKSKSQDFVVECPACQSDLSPRKSKFGKFWPCQSCNTSFSDVSGKPFFEKCDDCGKPLKAKPKGGKYFIYCSGYPECKFNKNL